MIPQANEWRPVTPGRLFARIRALMLTVDDLHGPIEETLFHRLVCDRCGAVLDATVDPLSRDTAGWMMRGSPADGYEDRCPTCAPDVHGAPSPATRR